MLPLLALWLVRLGAGKATDAADPQRAARLPRPLPHRAAVPPLLPHRPPVVGAGGHHLAAELGRLLRHRHGHGHVQRVVARRRPGTAVPAVPRRPPRGVVGHGHGASASWRARSGRRSRPATTAPSTGSAGSSSACSPSSSSPRRCSATRRRVGRAKLLASRPLVYLGTVSLGFYLFHLALMTNIQEWLAPAGTSGDFYGSLPTVFIAHVPRVDRGGVGELPADREALPPAQGPAVVVGVPPTRATRWTRGERRAGDGAHARHHPGVQRRGVAAGRARRS